MKKILLLSFFLVLTLLNQAMAQDRTISGTVIDKSTNTGLPGVSVSVKGMPTVGTTTDINGSYTLSVPAGATSLEYKFIGYRTLERTIGTESNIGVSMETDTKQLGEVVVTALGVERQERSLGFATANVKSEELTRSRASNPMAALQGKIAGVNITTASGAPGASTKVILRGYTSIGGNNNPLYVVDGVPINNGSNNFTNDSRSDVARSVDFGNRANDINPDDIESMSILKGASATALYGSRAQAGVILITTKKGRASEKLNVDYTTSATFTSPLRVPKYQNQFGQGWNGLNDITQNGSWGPKFDGKDRVWGAIVDNSQQVKPYSLQENNLKDFYETGKSFINTIGISGGNEKNNYYVSYSNTSEDGIIPTDQDSYKRNTLGFRGGSKGKKLSANTSLNFVNKDAKAVATGQGSNGGAVIYQELMQIPRDISIVDLKDYKNKFNNLDNYFSLFSQNPYFALEENGNRFNENRVYGNVDLNYAFTDWLTLKVRPGGDVSNARVKDFIAKYDYTPGSPGSLYNTAGPGRVSERTFYSRNLYADAILSATNNLSEDLKLSTLVGYNVQANELKNTSATLENLVAPGFYNLSNGLIPPSASTAEAKSRSYGIFGSAELGFREYLFLNVVARNDWSSTLPLNNNSFFYPGANASFVFTDALPNLKNVISYGKIRAAWGKTGRSGDPYQIANVFVPASVGLNFGNINFPLNGVGSFEVSNQLNNVNLKPEITREVEVGGNLEFFSGRIKSDISYYNRASNNQILAVAVPASSGYTTAVKNIGKIENKGIELGLTVTPIRTDDFNWDIRYTFSNNRNKVVSLIEGVNEIVLTSAYGVSFVATPGQPLGVFKGPDYERTADGKVVVNESGYPQQSADKVVYGTAQPKYLMGLYNTFTYKDFSFTFGFDYHKGGLIYSYSQHLGEFVGNTENTLYNDRQPFIVPNSVVQAGLNSDGTPNYVENATPITFEHISDYWTTTSNPVTEKGHVFDRTFLKLREVSFGYNIPKNWLNGSPFSAINVSLVGRNLLLFTPKSNRLIDPETSTFGNDLTGEFGEFATGPTVRSMGASIRVNF